MRRLIISYILLRNLFLLIPFRIISILLLPIALLFVSSRRNTLPYYLRWLGAIDSVGNSQLDGDAYYKRKVKNPKSYKSRVYYQFIHNCEFISCKYLGIQTKYLNKRKIRIINHNNGVTVYTYTYNNNLKFMVTRIYNFKFIEINIMLGWNMSQLLNTHINKLPPNQVLKSCNKIGIRWLGYQ